MTKSLWKDLPRNMAGHAFDAYPVLSQPVVEKNDGKTATVAWKPEGCSHCKYKVQWWYDGEEPVEKNALCTQTRFFLRNMKPGLTVGFCVAAVLGTGNESLTADYTPVVFLPTAPLPPIAIDVYNCSKNQTTSLVVKIAHSDFLIKNFEISVMSMSDGNKKTQATSENVTIIDGLTAGDLYEVFVTAIQGQLHSTPCIFPRTVQTYPDEVDKIDVQKIAPRSITFRWKAVFGVTSYVIKWRRHDQNYTEMKTNEAIFIPVGLQSGQLYFLTVAAENSAGCGKFIEPLDVYTDLEAPSNIETSTKHTVNGPTIEVIFDRTEQLVDIYTVGVLEEEQLSVSTHSCHATIEGLKLGSEYTAYVEASGVKSGIKSLKSLAAPIWTRPDKVKSVTERVLKKNSRLISWKPEKGAMAYVAKLFQNAMVKEVEITEAQIVFEDLPADEKYSVSISARNSGGLGEFSDTISFHTALPPPTDIVISNVLGYLDSAIGVRFTGSGHEKTSYQISIKETSTLATIKEIKTTEPCTEFHNLQPGTQYVIMLRALGEEEDGNSDFTQSPTIFTRCEKVVGVEPQMLSAGTVLLRWKRSHGANKYQIKYRATTDGVHTTLKCEGEDSLLENLQLGQTYQALVTAENASGLGVDSDIVSFRTGTPPPSNVKTKTNEISPSTALDVFFTAPHPKPKKYGITAVGITTSDVCESVTVNNFTTIPNLQSGCQYIVYVNSVDDEDEKLNSEKVASDPIWTCPSQVSDIEVSMETFTAHNVSWTPASGATSYVVTWRRQGRKAESKTTQAAEVLLDNLALNTEYGVQIIPQNSSGKGNSSEIVAFQTALHPPTDIIVKTNERNPTSCIDVKFTASHVPAKSYRIRAISLQGGPDIEIESNRNFATLDGLESGKSYKVGVTSLHYSNDRLNSEEMFFIEEVWTCPAKLKIEASNLPLKRQKLKWNDLGGSARFEVKFRIENGEWQTLSTERSEAILEDLLPGTNYESQVVAINQAGRGEISDIITFSTVPSTPENIMRKDVSTDDVVITCDACPGCKEYEFRITPTFGGEQYTQTCTKPEYRMKCTGECVKFQVEVRAKNSAGCSEYSHRLEFRQVLRFLRQKFQRLARVHLPYESFVPTVILDVTSGKTGSDFGRIFKPSKGDLVLLDSNQFSGKTALCTHYVQSAPATELVIFMNYDDMKDSTQKQDVKSLLKLFMKNIDESEMDSAFEWMKENSRNVTIVVDNVFLPDAFQESSCTYESKETPALIMYNLLTPNRHLLPDCKVICTSSQESLNRILKPTTHLKILGLQNDSIRTLTTRILGSSEGVEIPAHLKYFCCSPGYCETILNALSANKDLDTQSAAAVITEVFVRYFGHHTERERRAKLKRFTGDMVAVGEELANKDIMPKKIDKLKGKPRLNLGTIDEQSEYTAAVSNTSFGVNSHPAAEANCQELHATLMRALYLTLFQPEETFAKKFEKQNLDMRGHTMVWILVAGFLREETTKACIKLFQLDQNKTLKSCRKKLERLKKFIRDNMESIIQQIYINYQITLDWFACCSEINDQDLLSLCAPKIKIKNDLSTNALDQVSRFLTSVPAAFCGKVKLKKKNDVEPSITLTIDNAIRDNPSGDLILQKDYESSSMFSRAKAPSTYAPGRIKGQDSRFNDIRDQYLFDLNDSESVTSEHKKSMNEPGTMSELKVDIGGGGEKEVADTSDRLKSDEL